MIAAGGILLLLVFLPWISLRAPEMTILRERFGDRPPTPSALEAVRDEIGLADGPLVFGHNWWRGLLDGSWGASWTGHGPVRPHVLEAFGISAILAGSAALWAFAIAAFLVAAMVHRRLRTGRNSGTSALLAALGAVPSFVFAMLLMLILAVQIPLFPPYGWGEAAHLVLPAIALGTPSGCFLAKLAIDAADGAAGEEWITGWRLAGVPTRRITSAVLGRILPVLLPQAGISVMAMTSGSAAVETIFSIPGIGYTAVNAARSQDIPVLQGCILLVLLVAVLIGTTSRVASALLVRRAGRTGSVPPPAVDATPPSRISLLTLSVLLAAAVAGCVIGWRRDPFTATAATLESPSRIHLLGTDQLGRDVLARLAHGTVETLGTALAVVGCALLIGIVLGSLHPLFVGVAELSNGLRATMMGALVVSVLGSSVLGAAVAVTLVLWVPFSEHTHSLLLQARGREYVQLAAMQGVPRPLILLRYMIIPALSPLAAHALLRLPGTALAITSLGFLGLGAQPPSANWGLMIADSTPNLETAPWTFLAPLLATGLVALTSAMAGQLLAAAPWTGGWSAGSKRASTTVPTSEGRYV